MLLEQIILGLPEQERKIVEAIRSLILHTAPMLREKLSYGVPYYFYKRRVCFIWPGSVPNARFGEGVALGFCRGNMMANEKDYYRPKEESSNDDYVSICGRNGCRYGQAMDLRSSID